MSLLSLQRKCGGAVVSRVADLAPLRFCTVMEGNLSLVMSEQTAKNSDYAVFQSLEEVRGTITRQHSPCLS